MPKTTRRKPEIMAPAGDWTCIRAAIDAGADAIYFGLSGFNMRDNSANFRVSELPKIAGVCHGSGVRAYLALNTIIYENEVRRVRKILEAAVAAGIDAVICWDMAVILAATTLGMPVFLSTQMSVCNSASIAGFFRTLGIRRFVLARECTLAHIRALRRNLTGELGAAAELIEIEVFAHGAMCVSVSGRCFMSEFTVGKSANRGQCTQPCRRPYQIAGTEGDAAFQMGGQYLLSPQDLCTLPFLEKLLDAGVHSLKLEGRGRSPEYVSTVTGTYRQAVDYYFQNRNRRDFKQAFDVLKASLMDGLRGVYHRGLSSGFFMGRPLDQWSGLPNSQAATRKHHVGKVAKYYRKAGAVEIHVCDSEFSIGDELLIQGPTTGVVRVRVESIQINHQAVTQALRGQDVAVYITTPVRAGDRVYRVAKSSSQAS